MVKYADSLRHPKWQRKRLEILNRDDFTCQYCQSKEKTLSIHHLYYTDGKKPWEYENEALVTLCQPCHEKEEFLKHFTTHSMVYLNEMGFLYLDLTDIISSISHKIDLMSDEERIKYIKTIKSLIINHG